MKKPKKRAPKTSPFTRRDGPISLSLSDEGWTALLAVHEQSSGMTRADIVNEALKLYARSRKAI